MRYVGTAVVLLAGSVAAAGEPCCRCRDGYFVIVWGAQRFPKDPRYSHSFATFIHAGADGHFEEFTISWLPVTGQVRVLRVRPEVGRNYDLNETLHYCGKNRMTVARWGPYEIDCDLWQRALTQKARLDSGEVLYKAYDNGSPDGVVSNCLHAISIMTRQPGQAAPRVIVAPANWGESGSYWIALSLAPWFVEPCVIHDGLFARLGLDPACYKREDLSRNPTLNPATRATQAALHTHLLPNRVNCGKK